MPKKIKKLQIRLTARGRAALKARAKLEGVSVSELIRTVMLPNEACKRES